MKKFMKKFFTLFILLLILICNLFPSVYAIYNTSQIGNEILTNNDENVSAEEFTKESDFMEDKNTIITNQDENLNIEVVEESEHNNIINNGTSNDIENVIKDSLNNNDSSDSVTNYNVLLAGILADNNELEYSNINEILNKNDFDNQHGIWIPLKDRDFLLNFINNLSNNIYNFNKEGFLIKTGEKNGNDIRETYSLYTEKIEELVNSQNCIIISINKEYKSLNEYDNKILDMFMEKEEYAMLFNGQEEKTQVVLLNSDKYNSNNEFESLATLMNHFLEVFYNNDNDFVEYVEDKINYAEAYSFNSLEMKDNNNTEEQYKIALSGIYNDNIDNVAKVDEVIKNKNKRTGIWVSERTKEYLITLINSVTQMTYGIDLDGYLYVLNNNGISEKDYNSIEKCLKEIINGDKIIIIDLNNYYMEKLDNSDEIEKFNIEKSEYKKIFNISDSKIVIINSDLFNLDNEEDSSEILISYILEEFIYEHEKQIEIDENAISPYYSGDIIGNMNSAQNVFAGPSNDNYAKVGSVSSGEEIHVLEGEFGWYQIRYETPSGKKVGFVPKESVNNVYMSDTSVPYQNGGLAFSKSGNVDIYYGYPITDYVKVGSIYEGEGVTFLQKIGEFAYIEYSSSSGTKRGLVEYSKLNIIEKSSVARVKRTSSAYAGPDTDFVKLGGAYYNEYVTVLEKMEDWVYVEYNTTSGRKCGYMTASNLDIFKSIYFYDFSSYNGLKKATQQLTVYGGPHNNYAKLGTIYSQEIVTYLRDITRVGKSWAYIEYNTSRGAKRGYVESNKLINAQAPSIPTITQYSHFSTGTYYPHKTAYDNDLRYYSIGNGNNTLFMVFGQHGWEDAWAADSVELVKIANEVMNNLSSFYDENQNVFDYWKIYIIPTANPDGITDGYSNNGPGRCTVESFRRIDMNRSWPANFKPYYTSRNYTGANALGKKDDNDYGAGEIRGLKDFIDSKKGNNNIILDVHGWLNQTYGDLGLGRYFSNNFGFKTNGTYGTGYLIRYGQSIGAKSCLVELPMPSSSSSIINDNYSGKLATSLRELLVGEMGQVLGGEDVNETCKIFSTGDVNVRSQPNTSSSIVTSLSNGTIVTRIKKNVINSNGYTWDKIKLSDDREGYIATNFLKIITSNDAIFSLNDADTSIQAIKAYLRYNNINEYNDTPTSIYDEETFQTVKVFQALKNLNQTGDLDRYTIEAMGFSIDASRKIIENEYYNTYLNYAFNYINYGTNNYPESYTFEEKKFVYGQTYSKHDQEYEDTKETETKNWNSWSAEQKLQEDSNLKSTWNKVDSARNEFSDKYKKGALALDHFLKNTGNDLDMGDISSLFNITAQKNLRDTYITRNMRVAEYFTKTKTEAKFALEYEYDVKVGENPVQAFFQDDTYIDWYLAAHSFKMGTNATVNKDGNKYTMILNFVEKDFYDWDEDNIPFYLGKTNFVWEKEMRHLHLAGWGRNFEDHGIYTIKVEWNKDENLSDDKITVLKGGIFE